MEYVEKILNLPVPTQEQVKRFKEYLLDVHSWYKHISLIEGGTFVIYLEPDLDREYPTRHPKLPFGNTKEGYQKAFGHLHYQYRINDFWYQDFKNKIINGKRIECDLTKIPKAYKNNWSFKLYPYCHYNIEESFRSFDKVFIKIENRTDIPNAELLNQWKKHIVIKNNIWNNLLSKKESDFLVSFNDNGYENIKKLQKNVYEYIISEREQYKIENELRNLEENKLDNVLNKLIFDMKKMKNDLPTTPINNTGFGV